MRMKLIPAWLNNDRINGGEFLTKFRFSWHSLRFVAAVPLAWLIGLLLLWGVYSLPGEIPMRHAQESAHVFWSEKTQQTWVVGGLPNVQADNIADAFIIGMAANTVETEHTALERALNAYFPRIPGKEYASCTHLASYLSNPDQPVELYYYGRYWGGFALMARLWLFICNFPQIRIANLVLQVLLALCTMYFVWRELGWRGAVAVLIAYVTLSPYTVSLSMQYYPCFYLGFGGMIAVCCLKRRNAEFNTCLWLFLLLGILTSYLDFLTYPSVVVGLPAMIWLALYRDEEVVVWRLLQLGLMWAMGYLGMWVGKWLMCALSGMQFTGGTVSQKLSTYTSSTVLNLWGILSVPFRAISKKRLLLLCLPTLAACWLAFWKIRRGKCVWNWRALLFGLMMLVPLAWVYVTKGHSTQHPFLCNRNLSVFFASAFLLASTLAMPRANSVSDESSNEFPSKKER